MASELQHLMAEAMNGQEASVRRFYQELLTATLLVPDRYQNGQSLGNAPYPSPVFSSLALMVEGAPVIPVFLNREDLFSWAEKEIACRELPCAQLLGLVPPGWSIVLQPGSEIEKEFSFWEIEALRANAVDEIMREFSKEPVIPLSLEPLTDSDIGGWGPLVQQFCAAHPEILELFAAKELTDEGMNRLVIALVVPREIDSEKKATLEQELSDLLGPTAIGSSPFKIQAIPQGSFMLEVFADFAPLYERTGSTPAWITRAWRALTSRS